MAKMRDPLSETLRFTLGVNRALNSILNQDIRQTSNIWRPPTDVYETDNAVVIKVEVAGMRPDDFDISFADRILKIYGVRTDGQRKRSCHCLEIPYGEFLSEVFLPGNYDTEAIEAVYKDGFLTITLPIRKPDATNISIEPSAGEPES